MLLYGNCHFQNQKWSWIYGFYLDLSFMLPGAGLEALLDPDRESAVGELKSPSRRGTESGKVKSSFMSVTCNHKTLVTNTLSNIVGCVVRHTCLMEIAVGGSTTSCADASTMSSSAAGWLSSFFLRGRRA